MTPTTTKHIAAIQAGTVSNSNIIGIRKLLNAYDRHRSGYSVSCTAPADATDVDAVHAVEREIAKYHPRADKALHDSGAARLHDRRYNARWTDAERAVIDTLSHFTLEGFTEFNNSAIPVWRAHGADGQSFRFINPSWQSGGNGPEAF